ncbi:MAG: hypothetical protein F6J94_19850 [Moorea sp. SIO1F2]|uniref:hypothetical protein n=1 Tax=unclassified Moorena TaxID=2683338 RepID=UPI0013BDD1E3|nr:MULTISPECIES: hypothetical protein [unclassified Moorena]NEN94630.1 hypothetical protein [Moorena sp. SIO3I7]NEO10082.1 hypothetical protein [Moorena sp. SIO3I8]NEO23490.1 hypothetical protein [Moorena sp. SIO4A5]NEP24936.1 hypothetical protein [Moorena sp. SIO3I6]NEQ62081.1 hypothetical protein [Moorena sp. SIO4A1]
MPGFGETIALSPFQMVWGVGCGVWAREEEGAKKNYCIVTISSSGATGISEINGISKIQGFQKTIALSQFKEEADR